MLVPAHKDRIRLVQRIRPQLRDAELPFVRLSAALEQALRDVPAMNLQNLQSGEFMRPRLEGDQLIMDRDMKDRAKRAMVWQRIAAVKSGLLVCSFIIPSPQASVGTGEQPICVDPAQVAHLLAEMIAFGWKFFEPLTRGPLFFEWSLEDLSHRIHVNDSKGWIRPTQDTSLACQRGVERTSFPEVMLEHNRGAARNDIVRILGEVLQELFFPFDGVDDSKRRCRLEPTTTEIEQYLGQFPSLKVFP